jgi:hypothetical protein
MASTDPRGSTERLQAFSIAGHIDGEQNEESAVRGRNDHSRRSGYSHQTATQPKVAFYFYEE